MDFHGTLFYNAMRGFFNYQVDDVYWEFED